MQQDEHDRDQLNIRHWLHGLLVLRLSLDNLFTLIETVPSCVRPSIAHRPSYADLTTEIMSSNAEAAPCLSEGVASSRKRSSAADINLSVEQATTLLEDVSEKEKKEIEELKVQSLLRRRSVEYLLQGAGAVVGWCKTRLWLLPSWA